MKSVLGIGDGEEKEDNKTFIQIHLLYLYLFVRNGVM